MLPECEGKTSDAQSKHAVLWLEEEQPARRMALFFPHAPCIGTKQKMHMCAGTQSTARLGGQEHTPRLALGSWDLNFQLANQAL